MINDDITFDCSDSSVDEIQLNEVYKDFILKQNERDYAIQLNKFILDNSEIIAKIKELNQSMILPDSAGIENCIPRKAPDVFIQFPKRFVDLIDFYEKNESWKNLKISAKGIADRKKPQTNIYDSFFAGTDYISFSENGTSLFLLPYCAVVFKLDQQLRVYNCDKIQIKASYVEKDEREEDISSHGEFISERYLFTNKDGTPSRRYFYNPIIKTVRYTRIKVSYDKDKLIDFPVDQYKAAVEFAAAFDYNRNDLTAGDKKAIFDCVISGSDNLIIEGKIAEYIQKEKDIKQSKLRKARE